MEDAFIKVVTHIFNNWTGLKLAVDHSMGGPNSKQAARDFRDYIVQYCLYDNKADVEGIQEALEDILDEEFETICQDGSPEQIAQILHKFVVLIKEGRAEECDIEFQKLPAIHSDWLNQHIQTAQHAIQTSSDSGDSDDEDIQSNEVPMEEDDGWTEVRSRRKR